MELGLLSTNHLFFSSPPTLLPFREKVSVLLVCVCLYLCIHLSGCLPSYLSSCEDSSGAAVASTGREVEAGLHRGFRDSWLLCGSLEPQLVTAVVAPATLFCACT